MKQKISLVLSGGGARGIAHIGAIEELEKHGYEIVAVTGTSMGALVGAVYAMGKMQEFKEWMFTLDKRKTLNLVDFTLSSQGLIRGDKVINAMKEFIRDTNIEELSIPYTAIATDIVNRKEVVMTSGSVYDAIRASISIPTVLTPVKTETGLLVDGGVVNNVPLNRAPRVAGDMLVAVHVNANIPIVKPEVVTVEMEENQNVYQRKLKEFQSHLRKVNPLHKDEKLGYFNVISKTISLMTNHASEVTLLNNPPDILINVSRDLGGTYDFFRAEEFAEAGRYAAHKSLEEYEANLA